MMPTAQPGAGDVRLTLAGEEVVLKCTPGAAIAVSKLHPGSFYGEKLGEGGGVMGRLIAGDLEVICAVIRAGAGVGASAVKALPEQVYEAGIAPTRLLVIDYVSNLANGGVPREQREEGEAGETDSPPGDA